MPTSRFLLILAALALGGAAQPAAAPPEAGADPFVGRWIDEEFEVGSMLELSADGRFAWIFSYGALDMAGQGRWARQADGSISLTSDPPVDAPRFELISRTRDENQNGILVRVADENNQTPAYLVPMAETADGFENGQFIGGEYLFVRREGMTITGVRVVSGIFGLESEAVPAAPGDVLTFRFHPNDLGAWNFQGERIRREGDKLILTWRDQPLDYVRVESVNLGPSEPEAEEEAALGDPEDAAEAAVRAAEAVASEPMPPEEPAAPLATAAPPTGEWVSTSDSGSALAFGEDGRFTWSYRNAELDLRGSGRWARDEEGMYRMTSDPPVTAPAFALVARERDPAATGVRVRIVDLTPAQGASLAAVAYFEDGIPTSQPLLASGERLFAAEPGRRITGIGFAIPSMMFESDYVDAEAGEVLTFRFQPNDLGVWNFQNERAYRNDGDWLVLLGSWPITYARVGSELDPARAGEVVEMATVDVEDAPAAEAEPLPLPPPNSFPIEPPLTPARRAGPPSGPFRPSEQAERRFDDWGEHQGRFESGRYTYQVDPQGWGANGMIDGPDGDGGFDAEDPDEWHIGVSREIEGNAGAWIVGHNASGLGLRIGADGHVAQICLDSGDNDKAYRLVVGGRPLRLGECATEGAGAVEAGLLAGGSFAVEAYHWAQSNSDRRTGDAALFPRVLELVRFLQHYRR